MDVTATPESKTLTCKCGVMQPVGGPWRFEICFFGVVTGPTLLSASLRCTALEQVPVPALGHPFGAREVAFESAPRPFGLTRGIDVQDDPSHLCPVGTFGVGVEQAQIGDEMFVVITGQIASRWGLVSNRRIEWRPGHDLSALVFRARASVEPTVPRTGVIILKRMIRQDDHVLGSPRLAFSTVSMAAPKRGLGPRECSRRNVSTTQVG
jgi:hypothetical protein